MSGDVGRMGEHAVHQWAAHAGLIANSSQDHDTMGWDVHLSWPHAHLDPHAPLVAATRVPAVGTAVVTLPADLRPPALECLVQVKSTNKRPGRWSIPVSHWHQFVTRPLPCFFLILEFDGQPDVQRAYLVHVGHAHAYAALKRVRKLSVDGHGHRLHKHDLTLKWSEADRLERPDGPTLRARIEAIVGPDFHAYVAEKTRRARTVGYERGGGVRITGHARAPDGWAGEPRDVLLDFQLGLLPHLEVIDGEVTDTRFGIDAPLPDGQFAAGRLEADGVPPRGEGRVRFAAPPVGREVDLPVTIRVAHDPGDPGRSKLRCSNPVLDIVGSTRGGDGLVTLHVPDRREARPLGDLRAVADVLALAREAAARAVPVTLSLRFAGASLGVGSLEGFPTDLEALAHWVELVQAAWVVAVAAAVPPTLAVAVDDLAPQATRLRFLDTLLRPAKGVLCWEASLTQPVRHPDRAWCMPIAASVRLGEVTVQLGAALIGQPKQIGTDADGHPRYRQTAPEVRIEVLRTFHGTDTPDETDAELHDALILRHAAELNVVAAEFNSPRPGPRPLLDSARRRARIQAGT